MKTLKPFAKAFVVLLGLALLPADATAIPNFARKYNLTCSSCHTAFPYLNHAGREFKEAGYRLPDEDGIVDIEAQPAQEISKKLWLERDFPVSARVKGYVVDKKKDKDVKIRPIHEIELMSAGNFWQTGSWFIEAEGEDEDDFAVAIGGNIGWHPRREANLKIGFGSIFTSDPYNSLQDGGSRLTVSHKIPLDVGKSENARFRKGAQFINFYGRRNKFFYEVGVSGGNGNPEGEDPQDFLARAAFDFTPNLMAGGFFFVGTRSGDADGRDTDLTRWGLDWNLTFADFDVLGLFMSAEVDPGPGLKSTNKTGYVEALYRFRKAGRPVVVPLARYGWTELNDGADQLAGLTVQLGVYPIQNVKAAAEFYAELDVAPGKDKSNRFTLLLDIVF